MAASVAAISLSVGLGVGLTGCGGGGDSDTTAPVSTSSPIVSGTTDIATNLSVTVNENGTGYYLVQTAGTTAPTVSAVLSGISFPLIGNTAATQLIAGLTASTAYKVYFIAKDSRNNVQTSMQSVMFTTATSVAISPNALDFGSAVTSENNCSRLSTCWSGTLTGIAATVGLNNAVVEWQFLSEVTAAACNDLRVGPGYHSNIGDKGELVASGVGPIPAAVPFEVITCGANFGLPIKVNVRIKDVTGQWVEQIFTGDTWTGVGPIKTFY